MNAIREGMRTQAVLTSVGGKLCVAAIVPVLLIKMEKIFLYDVTGSYLFIFIFNIYDSEYYSSFSLSSPRLFNFWPF